jgi:hypothetical protein
MSHEHDKNDSPFKSLASQLVTGILQETSSYLGSSGKSDVAEKDLGAKISKLANRFTSEITEAAMKRGSDKLAEKVDERQQRQAADGQSSAAPPDKD